MKEGEKILIKVNAGNNVYTYSGKFINEDSEYIEIMDIKEGLIKIRKENIIYVKKEE